MVGRKEFEGGVSIFTVAFFVLIAVLFGITPIFAIFGIVCQKRHFFLLYNIFNYVWSACFGSIFTYNLYLALGRTQYYSRTVEEVFGWNEPDHSGPLLFCAFLSLITSGCCVYLTIERCLADKACQETFKYPLEKDQEKAWHKLICMRSFHYIFWFLLLRLEAINPHKNEGENSSFARHLDAPDSTIELFHKWPWILQGLLVKDYPLHQFHLELDYQTASKQGTLFTIVAESPFKHTFFVLDAKFSEGILQLQLFGSSNNTLIEQALTSIKRTNDGHLHSIELSIDAEESAITLNDNIYIIAGNLFKTEEQHDLDMKLFLGAFNDSFTSIIGCVKMKNDTEDVVEQQEQATTKELGAKIISVTSNNNSVIPLSSNSSGQVTKGPPTEVFCRPSEETQCENHKQCIRISNSANFTCVCKHGYAGRFCQFSLFARTCEDAFLFHNEANSGVYQVDMDGSGTLPMTFVECRKQKVNGLQQILTIVGHNFPNQTVVRSSKDKVPKFFPVTYKLFSPLQIQELMSRSERCEQYIRYYCNNAPLNLPKTNHPQGHANLTLGQLKCRGEKGNLDEKTVTLKAQSARLELQLSNADKHAPFTQLEFDLKPHKKMLNQWCTETLSKAINLIYGLYLLKWAQQILLLDVQITVGNTVVNKILSAFTTFKTTKFLVNAKQAHTLWFKVRKKCEQNSDVSFHDSAVGYLKYLDEHLPGNPLNTGIVFSIHLSDEYKIVLTINNDTQIARCTVHAKHGTQFNDMRWLQIVLEQTLDQITMSVDDEVCEITGPHLLSQRKIDAFTGSFEGVILPPQPAGPVVAATPYYFLFVGGLPSVQHTRIKRDRIAYYVTDIPGLLGCMRGLMVNEASVDLRQGGIRPLDSDAVRTGCYNDCDTLVCHNGGHCTVQWQNYDPTNQERTGCDCSKTSYYGSNCLKDTGLTFTGDSSIVFDMSEPKRFFLHESVQQLLQFAFSSEAAVESAQNQHLTTIYFSDGREFHAILTKNSSLKLHLADSQLFFFGGEAVELEEEEDEEDESGEQDQDLNQEGGLKQQFFSPDDLLIHKRRKRNVSEAVEVIGLSLDASNVTKGETEDGLEVKQPEVVERYKGCMSNIEIDFQTNEAVRFRPLFYYTKPKDIYQKCFRVPGILPSQQRTVQFPVWEAPLYSFTFEDDQLISGNFVESDQIVPWWMWLIVLLVVWLMLMILLCCICRVCCCKRKKNRKREINKNDLEGKPILSNDGNPLKKKVVIKEPPIRLVFRSQPNGTEPPEKNTQFDSPQTQVMTMNQETTQLSKSQPLPLLKRQPSVDQSSVPSFSTIPSEKEYFPGLEEEEDLDDFEDVDSVLAKGFDENYQMCWMRTPEQ
uniref:Uncharacterized protein n=1 Tax=Ditylenchus dipsaci TaxID=166011 RepID=A0A915DFR5_9BILA